MTANQLRYWELEELKRSNKTKEKETERHDRAQEVADFIKAGSQAVSNVSRVAKDAYSIFK